VSSGDRSYAEANRQRTPSLVLPVCSPPSATWRGPSCVSEAFDPTSQHFADVAGFVVCGKIMMKPYLSAADTMLEAAKKTPMRYHRKFQRSTSAWLAPDHRDPWLLIGWFSGGSQVLPLQQQARASDLLGPALDRPIAAVAFGVPALLVAVKGARV
jgi:hypothetical protein